MTTQVPATAPRLEDAEDNPLTPTPQPTQVVDLQEEDPLLQLLKDISEERNRIQSVSGITVEQLKMELAGTSLDLMEDSLKQLLVMRDYIVRGFQPWVQGEFQKQLDVLQGHEERLEIIETFGSDTQILPEHAQVLVDVVDSAKYLATALLTEEGRQTLQTLDAAGQQNLQQLLVKCTEAEMILSENTLGADDEGEEANDEDPADVTH